MDQEKVIKLLAGLELIEGVMEDGELPEALYKELKKLVKSFEPS